MLKKYRIFEILLISSITLFGLYYFGIQSKSYEQDFITPMEMVLRYLSVLFHIAGAFWINEVYDFNVDRTNPHEQTLEVSDFYFFRKAAPACMLASVLLAIYVGPWFLIVVCMLNTSAFCYSLPKIHFKSRPGLSQLLYFICGCAYFYVGVGPNKLFLTEHYWGVLFWGVFLALVSTMNEWLKATSLLRKKIFLVHYAAMLLLFIIWNSTLFTVVGISIISGVQYAIVVWRRKTEDQKDILFLRNVYRVQMGFLISLLGLSFYIMSGA